MWILGISAYFHDSGAALLEDGYLVAAAEEERFTRIKHDYGFPSKSIEFCLASGGITADALDYVVFFEKPFTKFERLLRTNFATWPRSFTLFRQSMRGWLQDKLWVKSTIRHELGVDPAKILFSEHHLSHASSAFFCSPFEESAIVTLDGVGEWATTTIGHGEGNQIHLTEEIRFPHSIGLLYSAYTAFCGFEVNEGEYKVMGMAPYGEPRFIEQVRQTVTQNADGSFRLQPRYFSFIHGTKTAYSKAFVELFGPPRDASAPFFTEDSEYPSYYGERPVNYVEQCETNRYYADVAASVQKVTEDLILGVAQRAHRQTGSRNLCIAGGVGLNSVANGVISRDGLFDGLYVQPSPGDGGAALGAALYIWNHVLDRPRVFTMDHALWGAKHSDQEVNEAIIACGLNARWAADDEQLVEWTATRLLAGATVGWYQGRFEFGPRALGNRSILADPRSAETKDRVNVKIKFREPFRPFAPSVLEEAADDFFEMPEGHLRYPARFMLLVVDVKPDKQDLIPAVSHFGTARVQTVQRATNPLYHRLIERFGELSGVPVLLNTSFNVKGEVIVDTPLQAIQTFLNSGLDSLVMGRSLMDKPSDQSGTDS